MSATVIPFRLPAPSNGPRAITVERDGVLLRVGVRCESGHYAEGFGIFRGLNEDGAYEMAKSISMSTEHLKIEMTYLEEADPDGPEAA